MLYTYWQVNVVAHDLRLFAGCSSAWHLTLLSDRARWSKIEDKDKQSIKAQPYVRIIKKIFLTNFLMILFAPTVG